MSQLTTRLADYQLRNDAPRRPLDWRYRRAVELGRFVPRSRYSRNGDDELVMRYADLLHRLNAHSTFHEFDRIKRRHPDLLEIHAAYATMNKTELALLDGLLLSRTTDPNLVRSQSGLTDHQQQLYRKMFLDIEDRRSMSLFIATQLLEPAKLRGLISEGREPSDPESIDIVGGNGEGTLPVRARSALRIIGFYSSPIVLELLYSGFLTGTIPSGRDSAIRFLNQSSLTNIRRFGFYSSLEVPFAKGGLIEVYRLATQLALEEKEDGQIDIIQNIDALFQQFKPRIGLAGKILEPEKLPHEVFDGEYELTEEEMVETMRTGQMPAPLLELTGPMES